MKTIVIKLCRARWSGCVLYTSLANYQGCALCTTPELSVGYVSLRNGHFPSVLANGEQGVNTHREGTFAFTLVFTFLTNPTTCAQDVPDLLNSLRREGPSKVRAHATTSWLSTIIGVVGLVNV